MRDDVFIHPTAVVDLPCTIGAGTKIWHFSHVMAGASIGERSMLGQNTFVGGDVRIGNGVRIQNNVSLYDGVTVEDDVFLGPSCVLTNVINPRAAIDQKSEFRATVLRRGATIGANATIVCGHEIGAYAFVGAGAVVLSDVPAYALVLGVPATQKGWMSRHGGRMHEPNAEGLFVCPLRGLRYKKNGNGGLICIDADDEQSSSAS